MSYETLEEIIPLLDKNDMKTLTDLAKKLYESKKYQTLRKEIENRRKQIKNGNSLTHQEIWDEI
jgi:hypothetical protein